MNRARRKLICFVLCIAAFSQFLTPSSFIAQENPDEPEAGIEEPGEPGDGEDGDDNNSEEPGDGEDGDEDPDGGDSPDGDGDGEEDKDDEENSGEEEEGEVTEDPENLEGEEGDPASEFAAPDGVPIEVGDYTALRNAIVNNQNTVIEIVLTDDIQMGGSITVNNKKQVTIYGGNHTIDEYVSGPRNFYIGTDCSITLKDMEILGKHINGIVQGSGSRAKATFERVTYRGPQMVYIAQSGGEVDIIDSEIYIHDRGVNAQEVTEVPVVNLYGTVRIEHLIGSDANHIKDAVFYAVGSGSLQSLNVMDNAHVTVESGSYLFHSSHSNLATWSIGENAVLDVTACGAMNTTDELGVPNFFLKSFTIEEGGQFLYTQRESTASPKNGHEQDYIRSVPIKGSFVMKKDSVFLYDSAYTGKRWGGDGGLCLYDTTVLLKEPRLFSIYNPSAALRVNKDGAVGLWGSTTWTVSGVNAVNYWSRAGDAAPGSDHSALLPDYVWNEVTNTETGRSASIGDAFSFTVNNSGVIEGVDLMDAVAGETPLAGMSLRTLNAKRFAVGNISPFTADTSSGNGVSGSLNGDDVTVRYTADGEQVHLSGIPNSDLTYHLAYGDSPRPAGGTGVSTTANSLGLRAVLLHKSVGELVIKSVPVLDYGEHKLPSSATTYYRRNNETVVDGVMQVVVEDTRGPGADGWKLTVRRSETPPAPNVQPFPENSLIFRESDTTRPINYTPVLVHEAGQSGADPPPHRHPPVGRTKRYSGVHDAGAGGDDHLPGNPDMVVCGRPLTLSDSKREPPLRGPLLGPFFLCCFLPLPRCTGIWYTEGDNAGVRRRFRALFVQPRQLCLHSQYAGHPSRWFPARQPRRCPFPDNVLRNHSCPCRLIKGRERG